MQSLTSPHRADERPKQVHHGDTLMLGTSAGIRHVHDADALPFDTLTYLLRADAERTRRNATGLFFVFDKRLNSDIDEQAIVQRRTERLRQLLAAILPHFHMVTHSDLEKRGLASTLEQVQPCTTIEHEELREYTRIQTAQVLHMHAESRNGIAHRFAKFGWILSRRGNNAPVGGEANFDHMLPRDLGIESVYTAPAFPLDSTNGKAPYLLNESDRNVRICIPRQAADIGSEVLKVQGSISRVVHDTLRATAETVLGLRPEVHAPTDELATLPLTKPMKLRISDERLLADLRELLSASLQKLLP